jgi:hypothetical protein
MATILPKYTEINKLPHHRSQKEVIFLKSIKLLTKIAITSSW